MEIFYGQNKEDMIMYNHIKEKYSPKYKGNILEIGANDGVTLSNSKFFRDIGWTGYLVEPSKIAYDKLLNNINKKTLTYNVALGTENKRLKFFESGEHLGNSDVSLVSSLLFDETQRWRKQGVIYNEYEVDCLTWQTFIERYDLKNTKFDIISIDIEGMDYDLLSQIDLNTFDCKIVCVEFNGKNKLKFVSHLNNFDMELFYENSENLIFIKK